MSDREAIRRALFKSLTLTSTEVDTLCETLEAAGFAIVPKEPTEAMLDAADAADAAGLSAEPYADIYRAMLAASQLKGEGA